MTRRRLRGLAACSLGLGLAAAPGALAQNLFGLDGTAPQPGTALFESPVAAPARQTLRSLQDMSREHSLYALDSGISSLEDRARVLPDATMTMIHGDAQTFRETGLPKPLGQHAWDTGTGLVRTRRDAAATGLQRLGSSNLHAMDAVDHAGDAFVAGALQHPARATRAGLDAAGTYVHGNLQAGGELVQGAQRSGQAFTNGLGRMASSVQEDKPLWRHGTDLAGEAWRTQTQVVGEGAAGLIRAGGRQVQSNWNAARTFLGSYFKPW